MSTINIMIVITAIAFFCYGLNCIYSYKMIAEFKRFGLSQWRITTGVLQIIGASGLLIGIFYTYFSIVAASGLALLMFMGFGVRLKIKDGLLVSAPSFILALVNLYFVYYHLRVL